MGTLGKIYYKCDASTEMQWEITTRDMGTDTKCATPPNSNLRCTENQFCFIKDEGKWDDVVNLYPMDLLREACKGEDVCAGISFKDHDEVFDTLKKKYEKNFEQESDGDKVVRVVLSLE